MEEIKYKFGDYIVFKINNTDNEECAKITKIVNGFYEIKQCVDGLTVQGAIKDENIIRKATFEDLENLKGSKLFHEINSLIHNTIVGFESNLIRH